MRVPDSLAGTTSIPFNCQTARSRVSATRRHTSSPRLFVRPGEAGLLCPCALGKGVRNAGRVDAPVDPACTVEMHAGEKKNTDTSSTPAFRTTAVLSACNPQRRLDADALTKCGHAALLGPWAAHPICGTSPSAGARSPAKGCAASGRIRDGSVASRPAPRRLAAPFL